VRARADGRRGRCRDRGWTERCGHRERRWKCCAAVGDTNGERDGRRAGLL